MIGERGANWGVDWGEVGDIPPDACEVSSDKAAADLVAEARRSGKPMPAVVLTGGDLARTLGVRTLDGSDGVGRRPPQSVPPPTPQTVGGGDDGGAGRAVGGTGVQVAVDVGAVLVDGMLHWFVAHLVARRSWWWGRLLVVANASFMGRWNIAPRAHPGDGRLDTFDACPSLPVRLAARRRLPSGTHLPHPDVVQRRTTATQFTLNPALDVYLDGREVARASTLSVRIEPQAMHVWIPR